MCRADRPDSDKRKMARRNKEKKSYGKITNTACVRLFSFALVNQTHAAVSIAMTVE